MLTCHSSETTNMNQSEEEEQTFELEDQFILRLPVKQANKIHHILHTKPKKIQKYLALDINNESKTIRVGKKFLPAKLVNLPTIVESYKCSDKVHLFKTADIHQMLICDSEKITINDRLNYAHGLAPPLKNVVKKRFRKSQRNMNIEMDHEELQKELLWLLRMDNDAVASKFEFLYENVDNNKENKDSNNNKTELELFGSVISEESDQDSSGTNDIMEYTR